MTKASVQAPSERKASGRLRSPLLALLLMAGGILFVACRPSSSPPPAGEVTAETRNPFPPFTPSSEEAKEGERLFLTNCATCHGYTGLGDGPSRGSLVAPPANLTRPPVSTFSDGRLFLAIKLGKRNGGKLTMPPILKMADAEIWKTVAYLRLLSAPQPNLTPPDKQKVD